ncbi:DISARM system SNF2-like helicase DrmD [Nocardia sp. AG03]|uniref:DISARM system SNF2-like helicase DrmD n=1 Tax=Nocardia sp. AG03 TaxID=3025312 RepID=UPI0024188A37|nr:DISARM system SNF2-like helicase DrmD [Nocardia sp. AG03]
MTIASPQHAAADQRALPPVPEPGQIVTVRGSTWAVTDVRQQGLPRSPADEGDPRLTHVVGLQSLAEDRLGDELDVVWELEVGQTVAPDQGLPERIAPENFDDPNRLAAFVDAVRWGAVTSADADAFQSPYRSGANVEAYQLEPLRRALQSARTNLLLADDVGLGKTIEAGLVVQELLLRHRARSVIVVCPPSLALKWQDEMREKFGLDFTIVNSDLIRRVRRSHGLNANPFGLFPRVIVSMAWLPSLRAQQMLREVYASAGKASTARRYAFDVLVVDEAHHVAPAGPTAVGGRRGYAIDSNRTIATRDLAQRCEHRLFLSATPHNGYSESFTALLEMIDGRRFTRSGILDETALKDVAVRRLKTDIPEKNFKTRQLKTIGFTPDDEEQDKFSLLDRILTESARRNGRGRSGDIVSMLLKKRFLSSPWSFALTLQRYDEAASSGRLPAMDDDDDEYYQEVLGSGQSDEEEGETEQPEFSTLRRSKGSDPLSAASPEEIARLVSWGDGFAHRPDSKLKALVDFLDAVCRPDGKSWTNERVVVFTEYAATLEWIKGVLEQRGYKDRLAVIQGSTDAEERERIRARFSADPSKEPVRVLLATDSAGEGIDLQARCHRLVNYDIPFNPSRLEQRIGRIDRYGQQQTPLIFQFAPDRTSSTFGADQDFLRRIAEKVGTVHSDLGAVNQVIDDEVQQHFSPTVAKRRGGRKKEAPDDGTAAISTVMAGSRELNRRLTELANSYTETKARMHITPANLRRVVDTALGLTAQPILIETVDPDIEQVFELEEPDSLNPVDEPGAGQVFDLPGLSGAWQSVLRGLDTHLEPGVWRPVTFDDRIAKNRDDIVHVHLGHGLVQRSARILRSKLLGVGSDVNRVTAVVVDDLPQSCVAVVSRLVLVGRGGLRLHEEVFLTGIRIRGNDMAEKKVEDLLEATLDTTDLKLASPQVRSTLANLWNVEGSRLQSRLLNAMNRRAESKQDEVAKALQARHTADTSRTREIYAAFRHNLDDSLRRLREQQAELELQFFTDDQRKQLRRDIDVMQQRRDNLNEEEQREITAVGERYADIKPYVSVAAVVFALTPADAEPGALQR